MSRSLLQATASGLQNGVVGTYDAAIVGRRWGAPARSVLQACALPGRAAAAVAAEAKHLDLEAGAFPGAWAALYTGHRRRQSSPGVGAVTGGAVCSSKKVRTTLRVHCTPLCVASSQDSKMMNSSTALLDGPSPCAAASCEGWWWLSDSVASLSSSTKATLSKMTPGTGGMSSSSSLSLASSALRGRFDPRSGVVFSVVLFLFRFVVPGCGRLRRLEQTSRST